MTTYYTLGRSGLRVSRLALGTMTFGTEWGWGSDETVARRIFNTYIDAGGNFVDTADGYTRGTSERMVGQFIAERELRDQVVLATKFTFNVQEGNPNAGGNGRKNMMRAVDASLKRLGTDYIDLYYLHVWDHLTPPEEVMRGFDALIRSGKIRYAGLSDTPAWYASQAQTYARGSALEPIAALQLEYSLAERSIEEEHLPMGIALGMGTAAWSPLASGLLSGKYRPGEGSCRGRLDIMKGKHPALAKFTERNWKIVAELERVAKELGKSMAQVALNWVANRPGIASIIIGATKLEQLQDNLGCLDFDIPPALLARLDEVSAPEPHFPYTFFQPGMQAAIHGGASVGDKPPAYTAPWLVAGPPPSIAAQR